MTFSTVMTPTSTSLLQPVTLPSPHERSLIIDIEEFWSAFPCPPPWKPRLLIEVNASRLDPLVSKTLRSFLAGKCDIRHVLSGSDGGYIQEPGDLGRGRVVRPTDGPDLRSSLSDPATSHHKWCDAACQLSFGCAIFVVVAVMMMSLILCVNKHRVRHKMAATRPSRQHLQLSTSTSDPANYGEFLNNEVRGEDLFYPPFRHRGLPHPPRSCHPSCDQNWNCPVCSSFHPLMRMSSPDHLYSHTYSAVYETIDDIDEEEGEITDNGRDNQLRDTTPVITEPTNNQSCAPYEISPPGVSTAQNQPSCNGDSKGDQVVAETRFSCQVSTQTLRRTGPPKYVEFDQNCAFYSPCQSLINDSQPVNPGTQKTAGDHNTQDSWQVLSKSRDFSVLSNNSLHSSLAGQAHHNVSPNNTDLYKSSSDIEAPIRYNTQRSNKVIPRSSSSQPQIFSLVHSDRSYHQLCEGHENSYTNHHPSLQQKHARIGGHSFQSNKSHVCTATSSFFPNIPSQYFCAACQQDNVARPGNRQTVSAAPRQPNSVQMFLERTTAPDLLKETSKHYGTTDRFRPRSGEDNQTTNDVCSQSTTPALNVKLSAKQPNSGGTRNV